MRGNQPASHRLSFYLQSLYFLTGKPAKAQMFFRSFPVPRLEHSLIFDVHPMG